MGKKNKETKVIKPKDDYPFGDYETYKKRRETLTGKKYSAGGVAIGGGHKNYKMTGMIKAKTGKLT